MAANITFNFLDCVARRGFNLRVTCRCKHIGFVDARLAAQWFHIHRWNRALEVAHLHFRCSHCGRRGQCRVSPAPKDLPLSFPHWGPHGDREWQERVRRLRG